MLLTVMQQEEHRLESFGTNIGHIELNFSLVLRKAPAPA